MAGDGSNTKLTDENRVKIKEAAAIGASAEEMAYFCNVSKQTIYNWFKVDPELFDEIERLRERPVLKARQTIVKALDDPEQAKWFLARKRKKEFSERTEQDVDVTSGGKPIYGSLSRHNINEENIQPQEEN